mmetsp:Transcript_45220/g.134963  ORF Transcript_45220/g.134963 Transcript_45220/m.134963 type:complete len:101 (-) Transcript_45220:375-677(-)
MFRANHTQKLLMKTSVGEGGQTSQRQKAGGGFSTKLVLAALYAGNMLTSYMLMLAVMTYNSGCFLAVILGLGLGFLLFVDAGSAAANRSDSCCTHLLSGT